MADRRTPQFEGAGHDDGESSVAEQVTTTMGRDDAATTLEEKEATTGEHGATEHTGKVEGRQAVEGETAGDRQEAGSGQPDALAARRGEGKGEAKTSMACEATKEKLHEVMEARWDNCQRWENQDWETEWNSA